MNEQALRNLLNSARNNIAAIDADLAEMQHKYRGRWTHDAMHHQGYAEGRKAELESLATTLEMALGVFKS